MIWTAWGDVKILLRDRCGSGPSTDRSLDHRPTAGPTDPGQEASTRSRADSPPRRRPGPLERRGARSRRSAGVAWWRPPSSPVLGPRACPRPRPRARLRPRLVLRAALAVMAAAASDGKRTEGHESWSSLWGWGVFAASPPSSPSALTSPPCPDRNATVLALPIL